MSKFHDNLTFSSEVTATLVIFKTMDKKEFRVFIKHCFLMGKNIVKAKQWLDKRYGDSARGKSTIIDWYAEFKHGCTNTNDVERSVRSKSAVVPENITKVYKIVLGDRKLKLREIAQQWAGILVSLFWDAHGILFIDYLEKGNSILCA